MENMEQQVSKEAFDKEKQTNTSIQYLTFYLGKEIYGIAVEKVKEVIEYHQVYKIPLVPSYISGVINLRGEILPVIDLCYLFYGKECEITKSTGIIFIECDFHNEIIVLGIIIDAVDSVTDILEGNIESKPAFGEKIPLDYIKGVGKVDDRLIILLDISMVLNIEQLSKFKAAGTIQ